MTPTNFLRSTGDRTIFWSGPASTSLAEDWDHTIADEMDEVAVKRLHRIEVRDGNGDPDQAVLEIRYRKIRILRPIGMPKYYPALTLPVIHAEERETPNNRNKIDWKSIGS